MLSNQPPPAVRDEGAPVKHQILFHHSGGPYFKFTNFSDHPMKYNGKVYPTCQHLYQPFKVG